MDDTMTSEQVRLLEQITPWLAYALRPATAMQIADGLGVDVNDVNVVLKHRDPRSRRFFVRTDPERTYEVSFKYWARSALTDAQVDAAHHHRRYAAEAPR